MCLRVGGFLAFYVARLEAIWFGVSQIEHERVAAKASFTKFFAIRDAAW
jgi:hypothetical protein